jgi:hypothetical protein
MDGRGSGAHQQAVARIVRRGGSAQGRRSGSPQALDLGRRWIALAEEFTKGDPELTRSLLAIYREGFSDPQLVRHMPFSAEVQRFINEVFARLTGTVQSGGQKEA